LTWKDQPHSLHQCSCLELSPTCVERKTHWTLCPSSSPLGILANDGVLHWEARLQHSVVTPCSRPSMDALLHSKSNPFTPLFASFTAGTGVPPPVLATLLGGMTSASSRHALFTQYGCTLFTVSSRLGHPNDALCCNPRQPPLQLKVMKTAITQPPTWPMIPP
jgi:hypothetical protein